MNQLCNKKIIKCVETDASKPQIIIMIIYDNFTSFEDARDLKNRRFEFVSKFRHENKYLYCNLMPI